MQIILAPAKTMLDSVPRKIDFATEPYFDADATVAAAETATYSVAELRDMFNVNPAIAMETWHYYQSFADRSSRLPAGLAYDGIVFKRLGFELMSDDELRRANRSVIICSFLYGLLRPLDLIKPYRMEGDVTLTCRGDGNMFDFWRDRLTGRLIDMVSDDDGLLLNLASAEMQRLFDWRGVCRSVRVISPVFKVIKEGRERSVTIYAKICRGAMTRFVLDNNIDSTDGLEAFDYDGFAFDRYDKAGNPVFIKFES